jgi:molybdate transport system ATP-binding protein
LNNASIILNNATVDQYGKKVLDGVSFEIKSGEHLAIVGPGGSGKSTLAKVIAGKIFCKGHFEIHYVSNGMQPRTVLLESSESFRNRSNVSDFYYQQRFNSCDADDAFTVEAELDRVNTLQQDLDPYLSRFNLLHRKYTPVIQLSNGEQKKLQLIKGLLQDSQVLVLDNVFMGLDIASRRELHLVLDELAASGVTIVLITDDKEMPGCITHIAELSRGQLTQFSPRESFISKYPENPVPGINNIPATLFNNEVKSFDSIVKMNDVTIKYGDKVILSSINWEVKQGEHWLVKGHNGAGKSTLLSLITADNPQAYSQDIYLFDRKRGTGESIWDIKKRIGFVSPELHKFFDFTAAVHHVVASGLFDTMGLYRPLNGAQEALVNEWMGVFGLTEDRNKPLALVSMGQQRRALLARALIKNPALLVLDEPCQGLDEQQTRHFLALIDDICDQSATTVIYVSHYAHEIPTCITRKLELKEGQDISIIQEEVITI